MKMQRLGVVSGFALVIGYGLLPVAMAQQCVRDPDGTFRCQRDDGTVAVGTVFSASEGGSQRDVSVILVEELLEEESLEADQGNSADGNGFGVFATGVYADKDFDEGNAAGYSSDTWGGVLGVDYSQDKFSFGVGLDFSTEDGAFDRNAGDKDVDELGVQIYGTYFPVDRFFLSGAFRYAGLDIDTARQIEPGNVARGSTDGTKYSLLGGAGYTWPIQQRTVIGLTAWLSWQRNEIDGYAETGAQIAESLGGSSTDSLPNLAYQDDKYSTLDGILEANVVHAIPTAKATLFPSASIALVHEFESDTRTINATLVNPRFNDPDFNEPDQQDIRFRTNDADENYLRLGAALTADFRQGTTAYATYQGTVGHDWRNEHYFALGLRQEF
jgi:outer membrane autotransporter protein